MRMVRWAALAAFVVGTAAAAQTYMVRRSPSPSPDGYGEVRIAKAALPGQEVRLWWAMALNPDCTVAATMQTEIVQAPNHGTARLSDEPFYPNYPPPNPRAACDVKPEPGKQAFYTAQPGFHGKDKLVLQNATSEGRIRKIVVDIDVR